MMQVAIHLGAHSTDEDRLLKSLLQNKGHLVRQGVSIPGPGRYRKTVIEAAQHLRGELATIQERDAILEMISDDDTTERVVLSFENFICQPGQIFENGFLYNKASVMPMWLANLFPACDVEFFIGIRNPATFIPSAFRHRHQGQTDFRTFLGGVNLDQVCWSDVLYSIGQTNPDCPITVWCNEETPLLWRSILQKISHHGERDKILGSLDVIADIMEKEGLLRLRAYLETHPPKSETQRRRILAAFLDKYAIADALEEELDAPGWTEELVDVLSDNYDDDQVEIARMDGVDFITL